MHYTKSDNFDLFKCIADRCPKNCCTGWQIMIDEDSLEKYGRVKGYFKDKLDNGVDFRKNCFKQVENRRCAMLDQENLCEIYKHLGENALCETCAKYPRHVEEFEGEREYSLSLSCPEAARIILSRTEPLRFHEWEDDKLEEYDDYDEFDDLLYVKLLDARQVMYQMIQNRRWSLTSRMGGMLQFAKQLQKCLDDDRFSDIDEVIDDWKQKSFCHEVTFRVNWDFDTEKRIFSKLFELEHLEDDWEEKLNLTWENSFKENQAMLPFMYNRILKRPEDCTVDKKLIGEQMLMFFVYTYFCGAVYDDMIFSKIALAVYSVRWIFLINEAINEKYPNCESIIETSYLYAREIEHSDNNINDLEAWFMRF